MTLACAIETDKKRLPSAIQNKRNAVATRTEVHKNGAQGPTSPTDPTYFIFYLYNEIYMLHI